MPASSRRPLTPFAGIGNPKILGDETAVMKYYDPDRSVDPKEWMDLDEDRRIHLIRQYHRRRRLKLPNANLHAVIHCIVESQVALGEELPAQKTLARLLEEGLNRHDAIHAMGSVLADHLFNLMKTKSRGPDVQAEYNRKLEELTAEQWLDYFSKEAEDD